MSHGAVALPSMNSPVLTDGGGLKHLWWLAASGAFEFPRPHRRGRIETQRIAPEREPHVNSPVLTDGGGLKPHEVVACADGR